MNRIRPSSYGPLRSVQALALLIFFSLCGAVCLFAAESLPSSGSGAAGAPPSPLADLWIPIVVPLLVAGLKKLWPTIPTVLLPLACPLLGVILDWVGSLAGQATNPAVAAALGFAGNGVRELADQGKKTAAKVAAATEGKVGIALACLVLAFAQSSGYCADRPLGLSLTPFATYRITENSGENGKFGGGLAAGYALTSRLTLEAEAIAEEFDDSHWIGSLAEAGANFKIYILAAERRVRPYALLGYTRNLDRDQNRMNAGAGVEFALGKRAALFTDGRWTHDFGTTSPVTFGHALFRAGVSLRF